MKFLSVITLAFRISSIQCIPFFVNFLSCCWPANLHDVSHILGYLFSLVLQVALKIISSNLYSCRTSGAIKRPGWGRRCESRSRPAVAGPSWQRWTSSFLTPSAGIRRTWRASTVKLTTLNHQFKAQALAFPSSQLWRDHHILGATGSLPGSQTLRQPQAMTLRPRQSLNSGVHSKMWQVLWHQFTEKIRLMLMRALFQLKHRKLFTRVVFKNRKLLTWVVFKHKKLLTWSLQMHTRSQITLSCIIITFSVCKKLIVTLPLAL